LREAEPAQRESHRAGTAAPTPGGATPRQAPPLSAFQLPSGRHGLSPAYVAENQRWRLLAAAGELLAERGYAQVKAADLAERAGVSRSTFYAQFDDLGDCLLAAHRVPAEGLLDLVSAACHQPLDWPARLRAAIDAALELLRGEPVFGPLLGAQLPAALPAVAAAQAQLLDRLAELLRSGRELRPPAAPELPAGAERRLVEGALALAAQRAAADPERLPELAPQLAQLLSAPYLLAR
jgi:AcrR family transcriptional regulator